MKRRRDKSSPKNFTLFSGLSNIKLSLPLLQHYQTQSWGHCNRRDYVSVNFQVVTFILYILYSRISRKLFTMFFRVNLQRKWRFISLWRVLIFEKLSALWKKNVYKYWSYENVKLRNLMLLQSARILINFGK